MDKYTMNIKFTDADNRAWIMWQKRDDRVRMISLPFSVIIGSMTLVMYLLFIFRQEGTPVMLDMSLIYYLTHDFILRVVGIEILVITLMTYGIARLFKREPDIVKKVVVEVSADEDRVTVSIVYDKIKKSIYKETISVEEFVNDICNVDTNQIVIGNVVYDIGVNTRESIYGKTRKGYNIIPETSLSDINEVRDIVNIMTVLFKHLYV